MRAYAAEKSCLMQLLTLALDDPATPPCGRCSVCTGLVPAPGREPSPNAVRAVYDSLRRRPVRLTPRKLWPAGSGRKGRIEGIAVGRALTGVGGGVWAEVVQEVRGPDAVVSPRLREAIEGLLTRWRSEDLPQVGAVVPVSSATNTRRVDGIAEVAADYLGVRCLSVFQPLGPAGEPAEGPARLRQVSARLRVPAAVPLPATVMLVDDIASSKWTLTQAAVLLQELGVEMVVPLVVVGQ